MTNWIDLTLSLNDQTPIYAEEDYSDPPFAAIPWSSVADIRFEVWQLALGTQTGTHIDAPAHFVEGGATIETLMPSEMIGRYRRVDAKYLEEDDFQVDWDVETHLLLDARLPHLAKPDVLTRLIERSPKVCILAGELRIADDDPLWFHINLARTGRFLAEDLRVDHIDTIPDSGDAVTTPLHLSGLSGSPARVLIKG
ncbi:MAG: cyclase family protein [Paracoccaceae bacterium]